MFQLRDDSGAVSGQMGELWGEARYARSVRFGDSLKVYKSPLSQLIES